MTPSISVVLPVYNGERYLSQAIDSVLGQTLEDFELIVVNDGSTDATADILRRYDDPRVVVLTQANRGLAASLNRAILEARAPILARMDGDDISEPDRLRQQVEYLHGNPQCVLLGSDVSVIDEEGEHLYRARTLTEDAELRRALADYLNPFFHGSVAMRRSAVVACGLYDERFPRYFEDMLLWMRLGKHGQLANLGAPLYRYRFNSASVSRIPPRLGPLMREAVAAYAASDDIPARLMTALDAAIQGVQPAEREAAYHLALGKIVLDYVGDRRRARAEFVRALSSEPLAVRAWWNFVCTLLPPRLQREWSLRRSRSPILRAAESA